MYSFKIINFIEKSLLCIKILTVPKKGFHNGGFFNGIQKQEGEINNPVACLCASLSKTYTRWRSFGCSAIQKKNPRCRGPKQRITWPSFWLLPELPGTSSSQLKMSSVKVPFHGPIVFPLGPASPRGRLSPSHLGGPLGLKPCVLPWSLFPKRHSKGL